MAIRKENAKTCMKMGVHPNAVPQVSLAIADSSTAPIEPKTNSTASSGTLIHTLC
jgi:hypothetical protein